MLSPKRLNELRKFGTGELVPGDDWREDYYRQCISELVEHVAGQRAEWDRTISRVKSAVNAADNLRAVLQSHLDISKEDWKIVNG